jgi:4-amino-4-deoxy-L-arabinose transferase-like glycosyltransferase
LSPVGIALYLLVASPWYVAVTLRDPAYPYQFFVKQNVQRYAGGGFGHELLGLLNFPILVVGLMPWTGFLPAACARYFPRGWKRRAERPIVLLLWTAALVVVLFFTFSRTSLVGYVLPAYPPMAVLLGGAIAGWVEGRDRSRSASLGAWTKVFLLPALVATVAGIEAWMGILDGWVLLPAAAGAATLVGMAVSLKRGARRAFALSALAGVLAIYLFVIIHTLPPAYERINKWQRPDAPGVFSIRSCVSVSPVRVNPNRR